MADENDQDANMKQVRTPHQLAPAQELADPPGVLLAVEVTMLLKLNRQAKIRIPARRRC
jgi:hypothetical protein